MNDLALKEDYIILEDFYAFLCSAQEDRSTGVWHMVHSIIFYDFFI